MAEISIINRIINLATHIIWYLYNRRKFRYLDYNTYTEGLIRYDGKRNIKLHKGVVIQRGSWLGAVPLTGRICTLEIKDGTVIGNYNHIYATSNIIIEEKVLTADKVYISDCSHRYENPMIPIIDQGVKQLPDIIIGKGSWIGENVCIIGASIGRNCVIGANSVVTHNIPDYSIAVGIPAKVVKRYNFETNKWERI